MTRSHPMESQRNCVLGVKVLKEMESDFAELTLRDRKTDDVRGYRGTWATFLDTATFRKPLREVIP